MAEELTDDQKNLLINSVLSERANLARKLGEQFGGDRDLYENFGYTPEKNLDFEHYWGKYQRQDIASTIVDAPAQTTWRDAPEVTVNDEEWGEWEQLQDRLRIYHYLERADRLSGIGRYGILLIGVKGGDPLRKELENVTSSDDVIYLSAFHEENAEIRSGDIDTDPNSERFGKPTQYMVDLTGENITSSKAERIPVHHSRVIHIAEGKLEDEVYGEPRLKKVYNRLDDLEKVVGGSAEMFWQGAAPSFEVRADDGADLPDEGLKEKVDEWIHNLRRYIPTANASIEEIDTNIEEPDKVFEHLISLISAKTGMPKRILIGSERGELASTQDENNWFGQISERQEQFAEPEVLRPLIDKLIDIGALDDADYEITWPDLFELNELEQSELHSNNAKALKAASGGMPTDIATTGEIREMLGLPEEMPEDEAMAERPLPESDTQVQEQFD